MPDTTVRVEYIGAVQNFSEVTITGNQQVWRIGSSAFVETSRASQLVASGKFRSLANDPAMLPANQAKVGASLSDGGVDLLDPRDGSVLTPSDLGWDVGGTGAAVYVSPGNGVATDYASIIAARDSAGVGGIVGFLPGKTYVLDRTVRFLSGQTIHGNGATIFRAAQAVSTTSTEIVSGTTKTVTLSAGGGANFKVGQWVNAYYGGIAATLAIRIDAIVGDTITCNDAFRLPSGGTWAGGSTIATVGNIFELIDNSTLRDLIFDGNKDNTTYANWEVTAEVQMRGAGITVQRCTIKNAPGEGIVETGVTPFRDARNKIAYNNITDINGNGVHLSASYGCQVVNNVIINTNLNGNAVGHNGGCITLSNYVEHAIIANNHLEAGRSGVGQIDSADNSVILIQGNTVKDMTTYMLECRGNTINLKHLSIIGNRFYQSSLLPAAELISVAVEDVGSSSVSNVTVSSNTFRNAGLLVGKVSNGAVTGNVFDIDYQAGDMVHNAIRVKTADGCSVSANTIKYGYAAIALYGNHANLSIVDNVMALGYQFGMSITGGAENSGVTVANNTISNDTNASVNYQAIVVGTNTAVRGNNIKMVAGHSGIRIYGGPGNIVQCNTVRTYAAGKSIRVESGSTGYVVSENQVTHAITDAPAVGVRVANNDIIV